MILLRMVRFRIEIDGTGDRQTGGECACGLQQDRRVGIAREQEASDIFSCLHVGKWRSGWQLTHVHKPAWTKEIS
ncbi:hypothetical protein LB513_20815 [Mesorhizobium sp. ES1-1]|nr:hypothetical protein [Mesorhizobium sp. ES1-1]